MKEKRASQKVEDLYDSLSGIPIKINAFDKTVWENNVLAILIIITNVIRQQLFLN